MTRNLAHLCLTVVLAVPLHAADKWVEFKAGPFSVFTTEEKSGREVLNELEQIRYVLGNLIGKPEMRSVFPMRFVVAKQGRIPIYAVPKLARDGYVATIPAMMPETRSAVASLLIAANAGTLPADLERGLVDLFSTITADGPRTSLGSAVPRPTRDWSRMHMLVLDPRFSGKLRVLLHNLQQGIDGDPAWRNAFGMTQPDIEQQLNQYIEAGRFEPRSMSGKPLDPKRQLLPKPVDNQRVDLALLDAKVANGEKSAAAGYQNFPGALDTPVPLLDQAKAEKDPMKARVLADKAATMNPEWAGPLIYQASIENNLFMKEKLLAKAALLAPRDTDNWIALARVQESAGLFKDAVKSWGAAERSAGTLEERSTIQALRLQGEQQRRDQADAERELARRKAQEELNALKDRAMRNIRMAEAKANAGNAARPADEKLDLYKENVSDRSELGGRLEKVECIGKRAVLTVQTSGGSIRVLVPDAGKLAVLGGPGALTCGLQAGMPTVRVEYSEKADRQLNTIGNAVSLQFR